MTRNIVITLVFAIWSVSGAAEEYSYQAQIKGMVCAFCAYSVNKNISALRGVDAESVDVDLKNGEVVFIFYHSCRI